MNDFMYEVKYGLVLITVRVPPKQQKLDKTDNWSFFHSYIFKWNELNISYYF